MKLKFLFLMLFPVIANGQDNITDPRFTEVWGPVPALVTPGQGTKPPSDAYILFDGTNLSEWVNDKGENPGWEVKDGAMTVVPKAGGIRTRMAFGDCQLHIEWRTPAKVTGDGQGRGNSGVFLMGRYEIQVLDSYNNRTYANGQAASVYKDSAPMVNATLAPGEWQTYDIVFTAPRFSPDGDLLKPAYVTVFHNGIVVQNHTEIKGTTDYIGIHSYKPHAGRLPISLQDHGNPVSFRNIWIRDL